MPCALLELVAAGLLLLAELVGGGEIEVVEVLLGMGNTSVAIGSNGSDSSSVAVALSVTLGPLKVAAARSTNPGVNGCVSSAAKSASIHRICIAGPTVTAPPALAIPHTPPRKSVVSVVHDIPAGTQYATFSPGLTAGNPSCVLVFVTPQLGPTAKPLGHMAGE